MASDGERKSKGYYGYEENDTGDRICLERARAREIGFTYLCNGNKSNAQRLLKASEKDYGEQGMKRIFQLFKTYIEKEWQ